MTNTGLPFVPSRGCLGCPHRGTCSEPRQRLQDPVVETGRHYVCPFYSDINLTIERKREGTFYSFLDLRKALRDAFRGRPAGEA